MVSGEACGRVAVLSVSRLRDPQEPLNHDCLILEFLECRGGFYLCAERRSQASLDVCDWPVGGLGSPGLLEARGQVGLKPGRALSLSRPGFAQWPAGGRVVTVGFLLSSPLSRVLLRMHSFHCGGRKSLCVVCLKRVTTVWFRRKVSESQTAPPVACCGKEVCEGSHPFRSS